MRGEELKGYLAGLRHAAALVREDAKQVEAQAWAMSGAVAGRLRASAVRLDGVVAQAEATRTVRGPGSALDRPWKAPA